MLGSRAIACVVVAGALTGCGEETGREPEHAGEGETQAKGVAATGMALDASWGS